MASYSLQTNAQRVQLKTTRTFHGIPLVEIEGAFDLNKIKFPFPIRWCLCVHDSPDNPCPCTDLVVWLIDKKVEVSRTGTRTKTGEEIIAFTVPKDTDLMIEVCVPMKLKDLFQISRMAGSRNNGCNSVSKKDVPPFGWVKLAAAAGYMIGGLLDDLLGSNEGNNDDLSDDLSDWLADNLPAPGWLQDLF